MATNLDYYYDNNETIYATSGGVVTEASGGVTQTTLGLEDLTDLSGQSTVFVNKVRFKVVGTIEPGTGTGQDYSYGHMVCGVIPADLKNTDFDVLSIFQDYRAWPLKMGKDFYFQREETMNAGFRMSFTYTPRKALLLNREQLLTLCITNAFGLNIQCYPTITAQFKRGD